jgi:uncharacterized caspase-like protein
MRSFGFFFIIIFLGEALGIGGALADKRVALVIGNSTYQHVPKLPNPANDAEAVGILFKSAGFDSVETRENLNVNDMRRVVRDFSDQARDADVAVIYYAGHGLEVSGVNYLVPVDASLRRDIDVEDEAVSLDRLLLVMEPAKRLRLVILDACRDNPFIKSMTRTMASRAIGRGLARVEPITSDTLVAFAAKAGLTAADGEGTPHSPFTTALLKHLVTPGLDVRLAFGRVRDEVLNTTGNKQEPFVYGSLGGSTVTLASLTTEERNDAPPRVDADAAAVRDYEAAAKVGTAKAWDAFLVKYPGGFYADLARSRKEQLATISPSTSPSSSSLSTLRQDAPSQKQKSAKLASKDSETRSPAADEVRSKNLRDCVASGASAADCTAAHKRVWANRCGMSAAKCAEVRRTVRAAVASGRYTATDYAGATGCGCGL